jgi:hypothetical protein
LKDLRVSVSYNSDINIIDAGATGYHSLIGHQGSVNTCFYSRNMGSVLTTGGDGRVLEWVKGQARQITVVLDSGVDG